MAADDIKTTQLIGMTISTSSLSGRHSPRRQEPWDHTYVVSGEGQRWGCFGRSEGGHDICRSTGNLRLAICLACEDGLAGIQYLLSGVCHQAANRILYPARVIVAKAKGYTISSSIYGDYGFGWHSQLDRCLHSGQDVPGYAGGFRGLEEAPSPFIVVSNTGGLEEQNPMPSLLGRYQEDPRRKALQRAIDDRLGLDYDREKRRQLLNAQMESFGPQDDLIGFFEQGTITAQEYFVEFARLHKAYFSRYEAILGREDFQKLFDCLPEDLAIPGDPELFAQAHGLSTPPKVSD